MSNYTDLKAAYQVEANLLTDTIAKSKALILIDQYMAALEAQATASANDVTSYSIGGRSVTRADATRYADIVRSLEAQLNEVLHGFVTYADFRTNHDPASNT